MPSGRSTAASDGTLFLNQLVISDPDAGSDALGIKTTVTKDGDYYRLNGSKTFITNAPVADSFAILARTSKEESKIKGGTFFILERGMNGLTTGPPLEKLGMRSSPTGQIFLNDVKVHKDQILGTIGDGFKLPGISGMPSIMKSEREQRKSRK